MKKPSQKRIIIESLIDGAKLNPNKAKEMLSLKSPNRAISNLRQEGFDILTSGDDEMYYVIPEQYLKENKELYTKLYENDYKK